MTNAISILKSLPPYIVNAPLNERAKLAAEIMHTYRRGGHFPFADSVLSHLGLRDDDVGPVYKELYGRSLHSIRVLPLQEHERDLYLPSSETGLSDSRLYYLRSKGIVDLRIENGMFFVHRDSWERHRSRTNGYLSVARAAEFLNVSKPYIRKLLGLGLLSSKSPGTHEYGNMNLIPFSEAETLKSQLEWINLSEGGRRYGRSRERIRQILNSHTLSAHKDKRKNGRKTIGPHWARRRNDHEVFVRQIDLDRHFGEHKN